MECKGEKNRNYEKEKNNASHNTDVLNLKAFLCRSETYFKFSGLISNVKLEIPLTCQ